MSAKRSWDVRREPVAAAPSPRRVPLKEKRKKARTIFFISLGIVLLLIVIGLIYLAWQPFVRISAVTAEGPHADDIRAKAEEAIFGTYAFVLPKNSIFIFPEGTIRERVLTDFPAVAAVSISRASFTSIHIKSVARTAAFAWCGESAATPGSCYETDAAGMVFRSVMPAAAPVDVAATLSMDAAPVEMLDPSVLRIYAPLEQEDGDDGTPLRAQVVGSERIPDALRFVKAIRLLNVNVVSVEIRGDEADLYTPHGTRITYILGNEEEAAKLAASALPTLNMQDGQLAYIDLRFDGKVYIKRHGEL